MDYKEEYQKALERAKKGLPIDEVFPELKESEDERIRKFLVELVSNDKANNYNGLYIDRGVRFDDVLAYLEKQKEQKPTLDDYLKATPAERRKMSMTEILEKEQKPAECWRPSIEQMAMLRAVINDKHNMASASANLALNSLYDDLIKL